MIKSTQQTKNRREFLQLNKEHLQKPGTSYLILKDWVVSPKIRKKIRMNTLNTSIQFNIVQEALPMAIRFKIKRHYIRKEEENYFY